MVYSNLNLNIDKSIKTININDCEINVLQYLPIEDKNSLIYLALQNAEENGEYNLLKVDMYIGLYTIYMFTDLEFTDDEKNDPIKLYDELMSNDVISVVTAAIPEYERDYIARMLDETMRNRRAYRNTIASVIHSFINDLPKNAEVAKDIVKQFNPEDFMQVIEFAKAANGGRPIN